MSMLPIASFLAGSLLTLLLPVGLLIALVVWYLMFLRRAEETIDPDDPESAPSPAAGDGS